MNILTHTLPGAVCLDGRYYKINSDFRTWIYAAEVLEHYPLAEATALLTPVCYKDIPPNAGLALSGILYFLNLGEEIPEKAGGKKVLSFRQDSSLIYSAFYAQYGIDLTESSMHYWKFYTLLSGLCGEHILLKVINIRNTELSEIKNPEMRSEMRRLKNAYRIKNDGFENPAETLFNIMNGDDEYGKKESVI